MKRRYYLIIFLILALLVIGLAYYMYGRPKQVQVNDCQLTNSELREKLFSSGDYTKQEQDQMINGIRRLCNGYGTGK